jgi:hypothetical protein
MYAGVRIRTVDDNLNADAFDFYFVTKRVFTNYCTWWQEDCIYRTISYQSTAATPALPFVENVSDDDSGLAGDATCATSADTAFVRTHRPVVWDIRVVNSDVPDAPSDPDSDKYFASSGFSCAPTGGR